MKKSILMFVSSFSFSVYSADLVVVDSGPIVTNCQTSLSNLLDVAHAAALKKLDNPSLYKMVASWIDVADYISYPPDPTLCWQAVGQSKASFVKIEEFNAEVWNVAFEQRGAVKNDKYSYKLCLWNAEVNAVKNSQLYCGPERGSYLQFVEEKISEVNANTRSCIVLAHFKCIK